jgi:hypothetical protein
MPFGLQSMLRPIATAYQAIPHELRAPLVIAGASVALAGASRVSGAYQLSRSYQEMLANDPDLANEDPDRVRMYYNTIASASPSVAMQPLVAGNLVKRMINYGGVDHGTYGDLVGIQGKLDSRPGFTGHQPLLAALGKYKNP